MGQTMDINFHPCLLSQFARESKKIIYLKNVVVSLHICFKWFWFSHNQIFITNLCFLYNVCCTGLSYHQPPWSSELYLANPILHDSMWRRFSFLVYWISIRRKLQIWNENHYEFSRTLIILPMTTIIPIGLFMINSRFKRVSPFLTIA